MDSVFSDLAAGMEEAIADAAALAKNAGMPESTAGTILTGVHKRAALIQKARCERDDQISFKARTGNHATTRTH